VRTDWAYDLAGNVTAVANQSLQYDAEGRTKQVTRMVAGIPYTSQHFYDGLGQRVRSVNEAGAITRYLYNALGELIGENCQGPCGAVTYGTHYITPDWLGSTRAITSATGATVARYDYTPFGEQILFGYANRGSLWSANLGVTAKTGKERDAETGLDYFGARYFSGAQGRFTSPDEPLADQHSEHPQSWNLYSYGRNNPLRYIDPFGTYVCGATVTDDQCRDIELARGRAVDAAEQLKQRYGENSRQYLDARRAIDAYGSPGIDNGVTITTGAVDQQMGGSVEVGGNLSARTEDNPHGQNILVTLATDQLAGGGIGLAGALAHEGSHVADGAAWVASGFSAGSNPTRYDTEVRGFNVGLQIIQVGGNVAPFRLGPPGGGVLVPGFISPLNGGVIDRTLAQRPYRITPQSPGGPAFDSRVRVRR
jgi:RHS repeat-associated protein